MNIFSIGNGTEFELTRENFIEKTHKKFPFYQNPQKYKKPYFAICPACNNPIQIINLFGTKYQEESTGNTAMHGRHFIRNVEGLPHYNHDNYECCPLHNPVAFRVIEVREDTIVNMEIKELVDNHRNKIISDIRAITGILFKSKRINNIIDDYIIAGDYCYTHTNRYNIPYSILYTREAINLFGQKVCSTELGEKIKLAITGQSQYFKIDSGRILNRVDKFVSLDFLVSRHKINGSKQYLTLVIEERCDNNTYTVFQEEIEMKQYLYR